MQTLKSVKGKRVLLRVDFNVAVKHGRVPPAEYARLRAALPTIAWLRKRGARIILMTHLGRPNGKKIASLSLRPVSRALSLLARAPVQFAPASVGPVATRAVARMRDGDIILLENLRFHPGEEKNDPVFARALAALADIFVNDAFSLCHRRHASVVGVAKFLPTYAGLGLEREIKHLSLLLEHPKHPFMLVIGGAKIETKLPLIRHLLPRVDTLLVGGKIAPALHLKNRKIIFPSDAVGQGSDIGPKTEQLFANMIAVARTVVWNGPLGKIEDPRYCHGSLSIARAIARAGAFSVVGGGDTIPLLERAHLADKISFVSMGGGAMLEYLSGVVLPGIKPLLRL